VPVIATVLSRNQAATTAGRVSQLPSFFSSHAMFRPRTSSSDTFFIPLHLAASRPIPMFQ
jgi:hypothetical protein